jgi:hypothetical protein
MITWDNRLISRHRAADMAGTWQLKTDYPFLRCALCDMNIIKLAEGMITDADQLISSVVRHMSTTAHAYPLSGKGLNDGDGDPDGAAADIASSRRSRHLAGNPVY